MGNQQEYCLRLIIKNDQEYKNRRLIYVSHSKVMIPCQFPDLSLFSDLELMDLRKKLSSLEERFSNVYAMFIL